MEQFTEPVEGQHDDQETAATHGVLFGSGFRWTRLKPTRQSDSLPTIAHQQKRASRPDDGSPPVDHSARTEPNATAISCRVKTDKRSGITNDPSRLDDPQYILRLLAKVISVSLETVEIVVGLPELGIEKVEPVVDAMGVS